MFKLALIFVEDTQVVQARSNLEMFRSKLLLRNCQRPLEKLFSNTVRGVLTQIDACPVEQFRRLKELEVIPLNQQITRLHLLKIAQTLRQGIDSIFGINRKKGMDELYVGVVTREITTRDCQYVGRLALCWLLGTSVRKVDGFAFHFCGFTKLWHTPMKGGFVPGCVFLFTEG